MSERDEARRTPFESLVSRLDEIAEALDSDTIDLDEALRLYEEGAAVLRAARSRLSEAGDRVSRIREAEDGTVFTEGDDARAT